MTIKMLSENLGRTIYDESKIPRGIEINHIRRRRLAIQAVLIIPCGILLLYAILQSNRILDYFIFIGLVGVAFAIAIGIFSLYAAVNLGFLRVYELGIGYNRTYSRYVHVTLFSDIEKISKQELGAKKIPYVVITYRGMRRGQSSKTKILGSMNAIADYSGFVNALTGRARLENL